MCRQNNHADNSTMNKTMLVKAIMNERLNDDAPLFYLYYAWPKPGLGVENRTKLRFYYCYPINIDQS